jgi:alkanesulfonate monooxygenase SsuD/methylene tetrahydromethanopterin reductase-like flavin-dependent oxidoreductase (luciferase family)
VFADRRERGGENRLSTRFVGTPANVVGRLEALQVATGADELIVTSIAPDPRDTAGSFELLAQAWFEVAPVTRDRAPVVAFSH